MPRIIKLKWKCPCGSANFFNVNKLPSAISPSAVRKTCSGCSSEFMVKFQKMPGYKNGINFGLRPIKLTGKTAALLANIENGGMK